MNYKYNVHTYNGGYSFEIINDKGTDICLCISGNTFADFSTQINITSGECQKSLTIEDIRKLGLFLIESAHKMELERS